MTRRDAGGIAALDPYGFMVAQAVPYYCDIVVAVTNPV
jgi:hypothetical protein